MTPRRAWATTGGLLALLVGVAALRLMVGTSGFGWPGGADGGVILGLRLDRLCVAVVVGAGLSVAGVALQALLRNALAEPYILGLSTGAAAGMMGQWWIVGAWGLTLWPGLEHAGALAGAAASMAIVFAAGRRGGGVVRGGL